MLSYQSASAVVFVCPAVKVSPGRWPTELSLKPMQEQVFSTFSISSAFTQHDEMIHALEPDRSDQPFDKARFKPRHLRSRAPNALLFPWAVRSKWRGVGVGRSNHLFRAARRRERSWNHAIGKQPSVKVIDFILKDACRPSFDGPSFPPAIGRRPAGTTTRPQRRDQLSQGADRRP